MFGHTAASAELANFKLVDSYMKSSAVALGLIGEGAFTSIQGVYTNAVMASTNNHVGGFIGLVYTAGKQSVISNCWFDGEIVQTQGAIGAVGGFVGSDQQNSSGVRPEIAFNDCLSSGSITGVNRVGGFYGWHSWGAPKYFTNCLVTAELVCGSDKVASFIGDVSTSKVATVTNSYTTGTKVFTSASYPNGVTYTDAVFKTATELQNAGVATLFPSSSAWKDVTGSTPVLKAF